jgi:adenine deaminase
LPPGDGVSLAQRRIRVALGQEPGDILITGGQVVNVFNRRVEPADVVVADGRIAGVGCYEWRARRTLSAAGLVLLPGLIDAHMHLESISRTAIKKARDVDCISSSSTLTC